MTMQIKNYPFEVVIAGASPSAFLADQVKGLEWRNRRAKHKGTISAVELAEVRAKIRALKSAEAPCKLVGGPTMVRAQRAVAAEASGSSPVAFPHRHLRLKAIRLGEGMA